MKKLVLLMLLVLAVALNGCDNQPTDNKASVNEPTKQTQTTEVKPEVAKEIKVRVYRAASDGTELLLPETVTVKDTGKSKPELALEALVTTKPQDAKYDDVVPIGTKVLGLKVQDGIAYADFSKELAKKGMGSYNEMMLCYAITNTLTEFDEIKKVQILVEGQKIVTISGHMDLEDPLTRNKSLLK